MKKLLLLVTAIILVVVTNAQIKTGLWDKNSPKLTELNSDSLSLSDIHKEVLKREKISPVIKENEHIYYIFNTDFNDKGVLLNAVTADKLGYYVLSDILYINTKEDPIATINVKFSEYPYSYLKFTNDSVLSISLMLPEKYKNWYNVVSKPQYINDNIHNKEYIYK